MEILIGALALGVVVLVVFAFKFTSEETKEQKVVEDAKGRRITDLEAEMTRKDTELKKMMDTRQKLEDEFLKAKDEADIFKKENSEIAQKIKPLEKAKEELMVLKSDSKQKDLMLEQETVARQKLQGELSLKDMEIDKLAKEIEKLNSELKAKTQLYEGLKGQFDEVESELTKVREEAFKKEKGAPKKEEPKPVVEEKPEEEKPKEEKKELPKPEEMEELPKLESKKEIAEENAPQAKQYEEIPGFPKQADVKIETRQGVPSDTDFLKAQPPKKSEEGTLADMPEGAFKLTNVNKPAQKSKEPQKPEGKDKGKSKRETLIPGFHPLKEHPEHPDGTA